MMQEDKLDKTRIFDKFVVPPTEDIRKKYTYRTEKIENGPGKWAYNKTIIERNNSDGSITDVYEYTRNYSSFYRTFEPFRQLQDGVWKEYALISPFYTSFQVLDLETGKIVAKEPVPTVTESYHERWKSQGFAKWCEEMPVGTEKPGWGFCPVEFHVPDFWDDETEDSLYYVYEQKDGVTTYLYEEENFLRKTGQFALYMGCVWGDDHGGWKIRYIDLSRLSEGIVTSDERFGHIQFAGKHLKEIEFLDEMDLMIVPVEMYIRLKDGKASPIDANWQKG